jgi:hypothetical protein
MIIAAPHLDVALAWPGRPSGRSLFRSRYGLSTTPGLSLPANNSTWADLRIDARGNGPAQGTKSLTCIRHTDIGKGIVASRRRCRA